MESETPYHSIDWNVNSNDSLDLPHLEGWNKTGEISAIESILNTSIVADLANNARTELEFSNECEVSKQDSIRAEVASVSFAYDPVLFCDILDNNIALSNFSAAVEIMAAGPKDPSCTAEYMTK